VIFKRASSLSFLMMVAASVPMVWAALPSDPGGAMARGLPQANLSSEAGLISLDFQDADIRNVLKVLAFKSGVNIVTAPDVTGVVSIELKDVPWQKALDVILSTYGYGFVRKDNIITVMTVEKLKKFREDSLSLESQEPLISKTFYLSFAKAEDTMKVINKLVSARGFINFDELTNAIIIRDLESNLELISGVIKSIDTVTPQVSIETKIVETDLSNSENLGIDWVNGVTVTVTGGQQPTIFPFAQSNKGVPFLPSQTNFSNAGTPTSGSSSSSSGSSTGFVYGTINAQQLQATLQFLSTRTTTKILSNPRIVTLDNQKAKINVGEEYPEATYSFNSSTGQEQVTGFTTLPIGVNFEVTPHVNNAGLITLDVHPQISALLSTVPQVGGAALPETSNQEAETNVMVEDGKTLVIAGLITEQKIVTTTKLPVLGDIPWLGDLLFKNTNTTKTKKEVLIFLTPRIITVGKSSASTAAIQ